MSKQSDEVDLAPGPDTESSDHQPSGSQHHSLKYSLLGPSLTKSGQDGVDQKKVSEIIYNASKGSKFFNNEEVRDHTLTLKIDRILAKKRELQRIESQGGLKNDLKRADEFLTQLECSRDLSQVVVHVDCDAFYAAVEELDRPDLKHKPFAVGKGVLTTCNYVARKFGCRSGMAGFVADKLCPQLIHLPLNFEKYTAKAGEVRAVLAQYDARFESASIDEAYLNITMYCQEHHMQPEEAVSQMREQVFQEAKITISAGIAPNAKLAKICSNQNKPNGQFQLQSDRASIVAFMRDLPTRKVNGIGRVFERELDAVGIKTCGDIFAQRHYLPRLFGDKAFEFLMGVYLGIGRTDIRPVEEYERKSVGTEGTFHDLSDPQELRTRLRHTAEELEKDLQRTEFKGRTLVLKIKLHTYEVFTRQVQPPKAVYKADELFQYSLPMLQKLEREIPGMKLRLMGLRCTHLVSMKKADVDFFGRAKSMTEKTQPGSPKGSKADIDEDGWQKWPDALFEDAARQERQDEMEELELLSQEAEAVLQREGEVETFDSGTSAADYSRHANGFAWRALLEDEATRKNALNRDTKEDVEQWQCPICSLPQAPEEKSFNAHIDGCLSKQTIREIVSESSQSPRILGGKGHNTMARKRGRPRSDGRPDEVNDARALEKRVKKSFFT